MFESNIATAKYEYRLQRATSKVIPLRLSPTAICLSLSSKLWFCTSISLNRIIFNSLPYRWATLILSVADPRFYPGWGFFHPARVRKDPDPQHWSDKEIVSIFSNPNFKYALGNMIRDVYPGSGCFPSCIQRSKQHWIPYPDFFHPGSRGQKSTGSRIRNAHYLES